MSTLTHDRSQPQNPESLEDGPTPEDIEAASDLPRDAIGRVVGDWYDARRRLARVEELATMDPTLAPWVALEGTALEAAERMLLRVIRAAAIAAGTPAARGLIFEGETFLALGLGDDPAGWRLVVAPGVVLDAPRRPRVDLKSSPMGAPVERPAWLVRALSEVASLGADEARRRLFAASAGPSPVGWDQGLHFFFRELGRRETFRRLGLDAAAASCSA